MITIGGRYTYRDLVHGIKHHNRRIGIIRWGMPFLVALGAFMLITGPGTLISGHAWGAMSIVCGLLSVLWPVLLPHIGAWRAARSDLVTAPRTYEVSDDGITRRSAEGERSVRWTAFRLWFESSDDVIVELESDESVQLPRRFFPDEDSLEAVRAILQTRLGPPDNRRLQSPWTRRGYGCFLIVVGLLAGLVTTVHLTTKRASNNDRQSGPCPVTRTANPIPSERFERLSDGELFVSSRMRTRWDLAHPEPHRLAEGDFLCRIRTLYGPPHTVTGKGFHYRFTDRQSGVVFTAYSADSGPAWGTHPRDKDTAAANAAIDAFDALLEATEPDDCAIEHDSDFGPVRCGVRDGNWFIEPLG